MNSEFFDAGTIVNTHGVRGDVKILPMTNTPEFLLPVKRFFIDGDAVNVLSCKVHKNCVIARFEGINDIETASSLRGKVLQAARSDAPLEPGEYFLSDVIGLNAIDYARGTALGVVEDCISLPKHGVLVVRGEREILVPLVPEFVKATDFTAGTITLSLLDGM